MFRYSALTFNSHKIHFDFDYSRNVEKYPGILVHGPLTATWCFELIRENLPSDQFISEFEYKATCPVFVYGTEGNHELLIKAKEESKDEYRVWAENEKGSQAMNGKMKIVHLKDLI